MVAINIDGDQKLEILHSRFMSQKMGWNEAFYDESGCPLKATHENWIDFVKQE